MQLVFSRKSAFSFTEYIYHKQCENTFQMCQTIQLIREYGDRSFFLSITLCLIIFKLGILCRWAYSEWKIYEVYINQSWKLSLWAIIVCLMCKNVINAFNAVHSTVQLAFFVDKSLTCKNQISPLIRFLKVQVLDYWECTFLLLFADYAIS